MRSLRLKLQLRFQVSLLRSIPRRTVVSLRRLPPSDRPFEEEAVPGYDAAYFYPVSPGDVVGNGSYAVITKLGWGGFSTVWLAKDLRRYA